MQPTKNQQWVLNPDGRKSLVSAKLALDRKFMKKHNLTACEPPSDSDPVLEKPPIPVILNAPEKPENAQIGKELSEQLFGRTSDETDDDDDLLSAAGLSELASENPIEKELKPKKSK